MSAACSQPNALGLLVATYGERFARYIMAGLRGGGLHEVADKQHFRQIAQKASAIKLPPTQQPFVHPYERTADGIVHRVTVPVRTEKDGFYNVVLTCVTTRPLQLGS